jgi:hypothetical protein
MRVYNKFADYLLLHKKDNMNYAAFL